MGVTDWLISSRSWTTQTPNIAGSDEDVTAAQGGLYLINPTPALSLLDRVVASMTSAGLTNPAAFVTEDRHVRLEADDVFALTWNTATTLRDLLGFDANLSAASGYTAPNISPLLWSPGKRLTPTRSPLGAPGQEIADLSVTVGPQGRMEVREEGEPMFTEEWIARHVPRDRYWTPPGYSAGEFVDFWRENLLTLSRFILYQEVTEGPSSTSSANYGSAATLGPYKCDLTDQAMRRSQMQRSTGFARVEAFYDVTIAAVITDEYTA